MQLSIPYLECEMHNAIVALCNNLIVMYIILGKL